MCSKEPQVMTPTPDQVTDVVPKIQAFIGKAEQPVRTKNLVEYTKDEAECIVEASLNYGTVDPDAKYGEMKFDEFEADVPYTDGKVNETDLLDAFTLLQQVMAEQPLDPGDKVTAVDVVAKTEEGYLKLTTYRVSATEQFSTSANGPNTNYTLNFRNRANSGQPPCNPQNVSADQIIQSRINSAIGVQTSDYVLTNVQTWKVWGCTPFVGSYGSGSAIVTLDLANRILPATLFPNPNDPDGIDPWAFNSWNDHLTYLRPLSAIAYYPWENPDPACLGPVAMTYLTQSAWNLMSIVRNTYASSGLVPIACSVKGWKASGNMPLPNAIEYAFVHNIDYIYGRWQYTGPRQ